MSVDREARTDQLGVCYLSALRSPGIPAEELVVRVVTTADVSSPKSSAQHVVGVDVATEAVRKWLNALCRPDGEPLP